MIEQLPLRLVQNPFSMVLEAARIKARFRVSFAAAAARREKASVVTGDPEFAALEGIVDVEWI